MSLGESGVALLRSSPTWVHIRVQVIHWEESIILKVTNLEMFNGKRSVKTLSKLTEGTVRLVGTKARVDQKLMA